MLKIWGVSLELAHNYKYLYNLNKILKLHVYLNEIAVLTYDSKSKCIFNENKMRLYLLFEIKFICKFMHINIFSEWKVNLLSFCYH